MDCNAGPEIKGRKWLILGQFDIPNDQMCDIVRSAGGIPINAPQRGACLLLGSNAGKKAKQARKFGMNTYRVITTAPLKLVAVFA